MMKIHTLTVFWPRNSKMQQKIAINEGINLKTYIKVKIFSEKNNEKWGNFDLKKNIDNQAQWKTDFIFWNLHTLNL